MIETWNYYSSLDLDHEPHIQDEMCCIVEDYILTAKHYLPVSTSLDESDTNVTET